MHSYPLQCGLYLPLQKPVEVPSAGGSISTRRLEPLLPTAWLLSVGRQWRVSMNTNTRANTLLRNISHWHGQYTGCFIEMRDESCVNMLNSVALPVASHGTMTNKSIARRGVGWGSKITAFVCGLTTILLVYGMGVEEQTEWLPCDFCGFGQD
jgi:hypothetical protein